MDERKIVLFDGVCNFCNFWVRLLLKLDKNEKFLFSPLQSEVAKKLLETSGRTVSTENLETVIYARGEKIFEKSSAAIEIARDLGGIYKAFLVLKIIPREIRDFLYALIANNRYKLFGVREECMMPSAELQKRFL